MYIRETICLEPARDTVLPAAVSIEGSLGIAGAEGGKAMTSAETICSILSRPSKIGVCARLHIFSATSYMTHHGSLQRNQCHQIRQSLLDLLRLVEHLLGRPSILHSPLELLAHGSMLLKARMQALELCEALAYIREQVAETLADDGVRQDGMGSCSSILDTL